ncbi:MAG: ATP-dependent protease ATPase subunit HslU [Sedimentisphaerales bacterium]|nr:ATP-dependent protease ATPase subunit HslU [Sedimentisphaerales bacterium]
MTPGEIVAELDKFIIGQHDAKRAVAIAIRNRRRRQQLSEEIRNEVAPKNIIMAGPTGVGKTEIARRLAKMVGAPFVKVEATKFTEIGYVGKDVESMVRDLIERAISMVREEMSVIHQEKASAAAEQAIIDRLLPAPVPTVGSTAEEIAGIEERYEKNRAKLLNQLRSNELEDREIEIPYDKKGQSPVSIFSNISMDQFEPQLQDILDQLTPSSKSYKKVKVSVARNIIKNQEMEKLIDKDKMIEQAMERAEQSGIIFLDEIDKLCSGNNYGGEVSRQGVQRDLLPMVEGCSVNTKYGMVTTDHILFIAAGAFSMNKPSDLMPELQGRFPIRVKLKDLTQEEFARILTEPRNSLTQQQVALLATEGVKLTFTDCAIEQMARKAFEINSNQQNIGARRLYAVMEKVLEEISFNAPDNCQPEYLIDAEFVKARLKDASDDEDLNIFGFAAAVNKDKN